MPTTYAHWRFGDKCIKTLPTNLQEIINNNRPIFDFGVHGPDIFFYYNCLKHNKINDFGTRLHETPYKTILEEFKKNYFSVTDKYEALSYILGFTCHFTLDSYCHGYIERKEELSNATHGKIESQFDRYLLKKDGYDPIKKSVTFSLIPSKQIALTISQLFDEISYKEAYKSIKDQKFYLDLLKDNSDIKRFILTSAMDLAKVSKFKDLLITKEDDKECLDASIRLDKYFEVAVKHYPYLVNDVLNYLNDKNELSDYFKHDFCPKEDYKEIPVLSLEEEKKYEINDFQD